MPLLYCSCSSITRAAPVGASKMKWSRTQHDPAGVVSHYQAFFADLLTYFENIFRVSELKKSNINLCSSLTCMLHKIKCLDSQFWNSSEFSRKKKPVLALSPQLFQVLSKQTWQRLWHNQWKSLPSLPITAPRLRYYRRRTCIFIDWSLIHRCQRHCSTEDPSVQMLSLHMCVNMLME